jgi:Zn/Cd-binding protein ZinT
MSLQIAVKTINDSAGPDGIIPILLVFGAYPRMTNNSVLSPITTKRAKTIRKTSNEVRRYYTKQYIEDVFRIRNSPNIITIFKLPIQSDIKV